jgi:hypothetical protein
MQAGPEQLLQASRVGVLGPLPPCKHAAGDIVRASRHGTRRR